jgi:hypothetical protein
LDSFRATGTPTEIYTRFRNSDSSGAAMAEAMRTGFSEIFRKNEFANSLTDDKLKNLVVEVTGKEPNDGTVGAIVGSFKACKQLADFDATGKVDKERVEPLDISKSLVKHESKANPKADLRLAYTININLPETTDVEVYNAIFSSIKSNFLSDE